MGKALADQFAVARARLKRPTMRSASPSPACASKARTINSSSPKTPSPPCSLSPWPPARVLAERGFTPDYVAGHSLGEYSALVAARSLQFADAVRLVRQRGRYMQEAVPPGVGAMAAMLRLPEGKLDHPGRGRAG